MELAHVLTVVQVVIIAGVIWAFYRSFIANTQSEKLVRGLLGLAGLWVASFALSAVGLGCWQCSCIGRHCSCQSV